MLRKKSFYIVVIILGLCVLTIGISLDLWVGEEIKRVTGVCLGVGASLSAMGASSLVMKGMESRNPEIRRQNEIDYKDERNTFIRYKAKAKAADVTKWCVLGISYVTILIDAPLWLTLAIVGVFTLYFVLCAFYTTRYQREV